MWGLAAVQVDLAGAAHICSGMAPRLTKRRKGLVRLAGFGIVQHRDEAGAHRTRRQQSQQAQRVADNIGTGIRILTWVQLCARPYSYHNTF